MRRQSDTPCRINTVIHFAATQRSSIMQVRTLIDQYAAYDLWANTLFVRRLDREPAELLDRNTPSSFPTLRQTLLHIRNAEHVWLKRVRNEAYTWPAEADDAIGSLLKHCALLHDHAASLDDGALAGVVQFKDLRGNEHSSPVWQMLLHCFNHSTYHRGQLVTMMRALGMDDIPASDMIAYFRSRTE